MVNKVRTLDFLPEIFRTETNRQFLGSSLDVLTSQPNLVRVEGFVGRKYGYGVDPDDKYVVEPSKSRSDYQLEPSVVFLKPETQKAQDYLRYPGIVDSLKINNAVVDNHDRLFSNQFYSWDPFIDYDKVVNYTQYYWIPTGPAAVPITTDIIYLSATYTVSNDDNGYNFTEYPEQNNPLIVLLRGGTYDFVVPAGSDNFWIQTAPGVDATPAQRIVAGVTNNGTDSGTITWTVPDKLTLNEDVLYYQNGSDSSSFGVIKLVETNADNQIDISDILGKKNYTSPNGVKFTNGLKVYFPSSVTPASYSTGSYYVDGVGTSIVLLPTNVYLASELPNSGLYIPWDITAWDIDVWDIQLYVPIEPQYITVSRNSRDLNAWTRANRWFHQEVVDETIKALGYVVQPHQIAPSRAQRPIIEYRGNLKLFNTGTRGLGPVTMIDTVTTDAFTDIQGKNPSTISLIDGVNLVPGVRVIFAADTNPVVRKNVYQVQFLPLGTGSSYIVNLVPDTNYVVENNTQVFVLEGQEYFGTTWRFDGEHDAWINSQRKTLVNQYPLYDVFDSQGISFGNSAYYPNTDFQGTKLFSYTPGTGDSDPVLDFPIAYSSISTLGDILFNVDFNTSTFQYGGSGLIATYNVNSGYVHNYTSVADYIQLTGYVPAAGPSFQYQVFEFPISTVYQTSYKCDVVIKTNTPWRNIVVYLNDDILDSDLYSYTIDTNLSQTIVNVDSPVGTKITILLISDQVSKTAYYQIPSNLENNPFNANITSVAVGDLRNQYRSIFSNAPDTTGEMFGNNNIHDLGNLNQYGTAIIQNSASLVLPAVFLRKPEANIFQALQFNSDAYTIYKQLIIDLAGSGNYNVYQTPSDILDNIIYNITITRTSTDAFFWSDMIFSGNPELINNYTFENNASSATFELSKIYNFTSANYESVAIYIKLAATGKTVQLIKDKDYIVSTTTPSVQVNYNISIGDVITVKEYNQTYGSYCPNTPTKLGLYSKKIPEITSENNLGNTVYFIIGHDGSKSKLYGNYDPATGNLDDFRDIALLEFEKRVYNNLKVSSAIPLTFTDIVPGQFRDTDYSYNEILNMYSVNFLSWVGANRVDYKTQYYSLINQFTFNYNQSENKLENTALLQGYWRGIYRYFYDTDNPAQAPWEMLGFTDKPTWWTARYGVAPYTSDNTYMWSEISQGFVWNDGDSYIDESRIRPGLLEVLPVNSLGEIISPFDSVMGNYNNLTFNRDWRVGDGAPAESAYLKSSSWPFDLMKLMVLTKPAQFFNLFADRDLYKFNKTFNQYFYNNRYRLDPRTLEVYGNGQAKHSYINWVVDFINQRGASGTDIVEQLLVNLDVRLVYNIAGFSAKNYLKFLIEKATVNSKNTSLLIPDESYSVLLYDNPTQQIVTYSSVIVQKTEKGYTVSGNSKDKQYFVTLQPQPGLYDKVTVGNNTALISKTFVPGKLNYVPYGIQFYNFQGVVDFINSYGKYLSESGVEFTNIIDGVQQDWLSIIQEFMAWSQQSWQVGSIISLNPNAQLFNVYKPGLVVQPLTLQNQNFILNQNLLPLQSQNIAIYRDNERFSVQVLNDGDTIAFTNLSLNSIEHGIVFDNYTVFNDTIYNLVTGLRQNRLLLKGNKTGNWKGFVDVNGFILNEDNIKDWAADQKYPKNQIVLYKNNYYSANKLIEPSEVFNFQDWTLTDYDQIKTGLLPNPSTMAYESLFYYDTNRANLENDIDLLSFSLIGFRPRDYLTAADLSDVTQVNLYKNIVKTKGTTELANSFKNANFAQGSIDYTISEIWSIKTGDFGAVFNNNFIECNLDSNLLKSNPSILGFVNSNANVSGAQQTVNINNLLNYERKPLSAHFLPSYEQGYINDRGLPSAGFVNINDVTVYEYEFDDLNNDSFNITNLKVGDYVWLANYESSWAIFKAVSLNATLVQLVNNLNGTVNLVFSGFHGLVKGDIVVISDFDITINGYHKVSNVVNLNTITIDIRITALELSGLGIVLKLINSKFNQPSDIVDQGFPQSAWSTRKFWVDYDKTSNWAVYAASPVFKLDLLINRNSNYGTSVAYTRDIGLLVSDGAGTLYRYATNGSIQVLTSSGSGSNTKVIAWGLHAWVSDPDNNLIHFYRLNTVTNKLIKIQQISSTNTGAIAASHDADWLYVANSSSQQIFIYMWNGTSFVTASVFSDSNVPAGSDWGASITTSSDGIKFIVGAPDETVMGLTGAGSVYAYTRKVESFYADGSATTFVLADTVPTGNLAIVYNNDVIVTSGFTITGGNTLTFTTPPSIGSIITVSTAGVYFVQKFISDSLKANANFGYSVATNRYCAEILAGAPYEINTINNIGVEGAVYKYTNAAQQYGVITGQVNDPVTGTIFLDGFKVSFVNANIDDIVAEINSTYTNIIANKVSANTFVITVRENTPDVKFNVIDVTGLQSTLSELNIISYTKTQIITNPDNSTTGNFGYNIFMDQHDGLAVSAVTQTKYNHTTFDYENCSKASVIFDKDATIFVDTNTNQGVVYEFTNLNANNESIYNPGKYKFGQYITAPVNFTVPSPKFGTSLYYNDGNIVVGTQTWDAASGGVTVFNTSWTPSVSCEVVKQSTIYVDKAPLPMVDINALNNISIYNRLNNETLEYLDYIDPAQGKILGAVRTNLDYLDLSDPASYNNISLNWTNDHIGVTWLNLNTIRILNTNQPDLAYNAKHWGKAFPGSTADVYVWIESKVSPLDYVGPGFPVFFDKFNTTTSVDNATNSLITNYYFWVKNYNQIPQGKTLSPLLISDYLLNPQTSGIAYLVPLTSNSVALYNCSLSIQVNTSILHLGYGSKNQVDNKHTNWLLIEQDNPQSFLSGLPSNINDLPSKLYLKFIQSFTAYDFLGNQIPDPFLPVLVKTGTSVRPRQSMFFDRLLALKNYIAYANSVLIQLPIVEIRDLSFLTTFGTVFDTREMWEKVNWWAQGYNDSTKPVTEVLDLNSILSLTLGDTVTGLTGITVSIENGTIIKVKQNSAGQSEFYVYELETGWTRIGLFQGTIQIKSKIYEPYGWDSDPWDLIWDDDYSDEIYWIIRWLNEKCYISDLEIHRNESLILMFKYIQSESIENNNYLPWLNKTSLMKVKHKIRDLLPYKKFQRDNQEFLEGFINEIKPYHVYIKEFVFNYNGQDTFAGNLTDFDLPAIYNSTTNGFVVPQMVFDKSNPNYNYEDSIWQNSNYVQWYNNFGVALANHDTTETLFTILAEAMTSSQLYALLVSVTGLPAAGQVRIGDEIIEYESIDWTNNKLVIQNRGANGTVPAPHFVGDPVYATIPNIVVTDTAYGYAEPPRVFAYIDITKYPAPRIPASLVPVMNGDKVVGISIVNPGEGYVVNPEIVIDSSITKTFTSSDVNISTNVITFSSPHLLTDQTPVVYRTGDSSTKPAGLVEGEYYYVRALSPTTVALYYTARQASTANTKLSSLDGRVKLVSTGSGSNLTLNVTARAFSLYDGHPTRELMTKLKYNRVSYSSDITDWVSGDFYQTGDFVLYNGTLYECLLNNIDTEFQVPVIADPRIIISTISRSANVVTMTTTVDHGLQIADYVDISQTIDFNGQWGPILVISPTSFSYLEFGSDQDEFSGTMVRAEKWAIVPSDDPRLTAADLVKGFYKPTLSMPGNNLSLLSEGVEYPNVDILTPSFTESLSELDMILIGPSFTSGSPAYEISGSDFPEGYAPEELIAGLVTDRVNITVTSNYSGTPLNFRIFVDTTGNQTVFNVNPFTQTTISGTFVSTGAPTDVIPVTNASVLVFPGTTWGVLYFNGEFIGFNSVDFSANTVTDLYRGVYGTIVNISSYGPGFTIQSVVLSQRLNPDYVNQWWYGAPTSPSANTTLLANTNPAAVFLQALS
jgi:hypothetical protein